MSSCITTAFETYLQACITAGTKVALDEIVLAYIPGLDHSTTPPRTEGLPAAADIVYRQAIDQSGKLGDNAVAYSIVMDTHVGDFSFNALYLLHKASNTVAMIVYKQVETKIATNGATQGNSIIKTMVMEYSGAALATGITVDASTWQVDMSGQLQALKEQIDSKAAAGKAHVIADVKGLQEAQNGTSASVHGHGIADVNGLQEALNGKSASGHGHVIADVNGLQEALNGKSASGHGHAITDVNGLQEALNGKSASGHGHGIAEVVGLQSALNSKASNTHNHAMSEVTGLVSAIGNIPERLKKTLNINVQNGNDGWIELDGFFVDAWASQRTLSISLPSISAYNQAPSNTGIPIAIFVDSVEAARQTIAMNVGTGAASGAAEIALDASIPANAKRTIQIKALVNNGMALQAAGKALYELYTAGRSFS